MVVPHQKFIEWKNQHLPLRVLFLLFCVPCWELHTMSFKMGIPLQQASLHMENFSLHKPYDWADCKSPESAFPASHPGRWLTVEHHRWLCHLMIITHDKTPEAGKTLDSKVDASLGRLTLALPKDFVVRPTHHTGCCISMVWLAWDHSRGAWNEELDLERELAWPLAGPHMLFHVLSQHLLSTYNGIWEPTWLMPHPFCQWTENFNPMHWVLLSEWVHGKLETQGHWGPVNLTETLWQHSLGRRALFSRHVPLPRPPHLQRILHSHCKSNSFSVPPSSFLPAFFPKPNLSKSTLSRGSWCYNVGMLNV